jgi:hypothetical protein
LRLPALFPVSELDPHTRAALLDPWPVWRHELVELSDISRVSPRDGEKA